MSILDEIKKVNEIYFPSHHKMTEKIFRELCEDGVRSEQKSDIPEHIKIIITMDLSCMLQRAYLYHNKLEMERAAEIRRWDSIIEQIHENNKHDTIMLCMQNGIEWRGLAGVAIPEKKKTFFDKIKTMFA